MINHLHCFILTADYWVIFDGFDFLWTTPKKIIECIIFNKLQYAEFVGRGDTASKKAFLIKKDLLSQYLISKGKFYE